MLVTPWKVFRCHSADIIQSMECNVMDAVVMLWSMELITDDLQRSICTKLGIDNKGKAMELTFAICNTLKSHHNQIEYLTQVCYALFQLENEGLRSILASILNVLKQPLPQGNVFFISL